MEKINFGEEKNKKESSALENMIIREFAISFGSIFSAGIMMLFMLF